MFVLKDDFIVLKLNEAIDSLELSQIKKCFFEQLKQLFLFLTLFFL